MGELNDSYVDASNVYCDGDILKNITTHEAFAFVVPNDEVGNWKERTDAWYAFFYLMIVVFGLLYLSLVVGTALLLWKRHVAQRFKRVKTFIAIDIALMILGLSRIVFLALDPWVQSGYFGCTGCIVARRLVSALGFPSLTASYTLVFITLWLSTRMRLGPSCVQNLKVLIPLCFFHYVVAVIFEIVGSLPLPADPVMYLLIGCESFFSIWGILVSFGFLLAGKRLLKSVKKSARSSSVVCKETPNMTRHDLINKSRFQQKGTAVNQRSRSTLRLKEMLRNKDLRAIRKVTLITYITATLAILYSLVNLVNLILMSLNLFHGCPGYINGQEKLHPAAWLVVRYIVFTLELCLAVLLTYSISDYQPILQFLKSCVKACCGLNRIITFNSSSRTPPTDHLDSSAAELKLPEMSPPRETKARQYSTSSEMSPPRETKARQYSTSSEMSPPRETKARQYSVSSIDDSEPNSHLPKVSSPPSVSFKMGEEPV